MYLNALTATFLPLLAATTRVLATGVQTAQATSGTPAVTFPTDGAFVFCSAQHCTGTCEVVDVANVPRDAGEYAPNNMGFLSIYWYNPGHYNWILYTCVGYYDCNAVQIGENTCYNLFENGVATDFHEYWYLVN